MKRITASTTIAELAALVCATLEAAGISAVLSGGAVVSIYTNNEYESGDLDFISAASMSRRLTSIGMTCSRSTRRSWWHRQPISRPKLEAWARREGAADKLGKFKVRLAARKHG